MTQDSPTSALTTEPESIGGPLYRDSTASVEDRVEDLLARMNLEEKAGTMMLPIVETGPDGDLVEGGGVFNHSTRHTLTDQQITSISALQLPDARSTARWVNAIQTLAAETRLGIPVTIYTDPRHSSTENLGTSLASGAFSAWPEALGFGAIGDPEAVREFADIARQEYVGVGLRGALHPQLDLATEPRWGRQNGGFGASADATTEFASAYIEGFQGAALGRSSVACMAKHFPGGGPQLDGEDPHFEYGTDQVYPGGWYEYHLAPFRRAISDGVAAMMPYYGLPRNYRLPDGSMAEEVGFAFNRSVITKLLREELGYDGIVCTDYGLITDDVVQGLPFPARAWGVEHLPEIERVQQVIDAGCDQFGGESRPELIVELVRQGRVSEERIDQSVRRLLRVKFALGLFENPFVDEEEAASTVGRADFVEAGKRAQRRSITVLQNNTVDGAACLPITAQRIYAPGMDAAVVAQYGEPVDVAADADVAIIRLEAPFEERSQYFLEAKFHAGSLDFAEDTVARIRDLAAQVPVIVDVYLDRPAILEPLLPHVAGLTVSFGSADDALLDVLFGTAAAEGRLPIEIPRSMHAVEASQADVPSDTVEPTFPVGFGLQISRADGQRSAQ